jgi:calcineurin-like phosphoesterase family protein
MDENMVENWNKVVKPNDRVYHLGDVCFKNAYLQAIIPRLNGYKNAVLIKGNHDSLKLSQYAQYFKDIRACHQLDRFILTHIPIHPESLSRWKANIHGHLHGNIVKLPDGSPDNRYINVSVEQIDYTPIAFETIRDRYKE